MQVPQGVLRLVEVLDEAAPAARGVAPRADGADVEGGAVQRRQQGQVVELGVVAQGDDAGARVGIQGTNRVVGHFRAERHACHGPGSTMFDARIADRHREVVEQGHGGHVLGQRAGADEQHAVLRPQGAGQAGAIEAQRLGDRGRLQRHRAAGAVDRALHESSRFQLAHQFVERREVRLELQQQFQRAAAGQAEAMRLVRGDAVAHDRGRRLPDVSRAAVGAGVAVDQVILDAAAGDRAHAAAILAQCHHRTHGARRRAPGLDHRDQQQPMSGRMPVAGGAQYAYIDAFQCRGSLSGMSGRQARQGIPVY